MTPPQNIFVPSLPFRFSFLSTSRLLSRRPDAGRVTATDASRPWLRRPSSSSSPPPPPSLPCAAACRPGQRRTLPAEAMVGRRHTWAARAAPRVAPGGGRPCPYRRATGPCRWPPAWLTPRCCLLLLRRRVFPCSTKPYLPVLEVATAQRQPCSRPPRQWSDHRVAASPATASTTR